MKTIHKFRLETDKQLNTLKLKPGYRVVRCEYLVPEKSVFLWVEQPLKVDLPEMDCQFLVAYSGDPVPSDYEYVDTALDPFGPEAYHVFEVASQSKHGTARQSSPQLNLLNSSPMERAGAA